MGKLTTVAILIVLHLYPIHSIFFFSQNKPIPIVITTLKIPNPYLHRMRKYQVPNPIIKLRYPTGFSITIPGLEGIKEILFGININKVFNYNNRPFITPHLLVRINGTTDGQWTYHNTDIELNLGDYVFYWIGVKHTDDKLYFKQNQYSRVGILNRHLIIMNSYDYI